MKPLTSACTTHFCIVAILFTFALILTLFTTKTSTEPTSAVYGVGSTLSSLGLSSSFELLPFNNSRVVKIVSGSFSTILLTAEGSAFARGLNSKGECGVGVVDVSYGWLRINISATPPNTTVYFTDIELQSQHTLFRLSNGSIVSAGDNEHGQLCRSMFPSKMVPHSLTSSNLSSSSIIQMATAVHNSYFLTLQGDVWGCGLGSNMGISFFDHESPTLISNSTLGRITSIASANEHALMLNEEGQVFGVGTTGPFSDQPLLHITALDLPSTISQLSTCNTHAALVNATNSIFWAGEIFGLGFVPFIEAAPQNFSSVEIKVFTGIWSTVVVTSNGSVYAHGDNNGGRLDGDGGGVLGYHEFTSVLHGMLPDDASVVSVSISLIFSIFMVETHCFGTAFHNDIVCSGKGICTSQDTCACFSSTGQDCSIPICFNISAEDPLVCSGHGICDNLNTCSCDIQHSGAECNEFFCMGDLSSNSSVCSGNGVCVSPENCSCISGFVTADPVAPCAIPVCYSLNATQSEVCSGNGECAAPDMCECFDGFVGSQCAVVTCYGIPFDDPSLCSTHGSCIGVNACSCDSGFVGDQCEFAVCGSLTNADPTVCGGHGSCDVPDLCTCDLEYFGTECADFSCFGVNKSSTDTCSGHGSCLGVNNCSCYEDWQTENCSIPVRICFGILSLDSQVCSAHGECVEDNVCSCESEFTGTLCNLERPVVVISGPSYYTIGICTKTAVLNASLSYSSAADTDSLSFDWSLSEVLDVRSGKTVPLDDEHVTSINDFLISSISQSVLQVPRGLFHANWTYYFSVTATQPNPVGSVSSHPRQIGIHVTEPHFPEVVIDPDTHAVEIMAGSSLLLEARVLNDNIIVGACPMSTYNFTWNASTLAHQSSTISESFTDISSRIFVPNVHPTPSPQIVTLKVIDKVSRVEMTKSVRISSFMQRIETVLTESPPLIFSPYDYVFIDASSSYDSHEDASWYSSEENIQFDWQVKTFPRGVPPEFLSVVNLWNGSRLPLRLMDYVDQEVSANDLQGEYIVSVSAFKSGRENHTLLVNFTISPEQAPFLVTSGVVPSLTPTGVSRISVDTTQRIALFARASVSLDFAHDIDKLDYSWFVSSKSWGAGDALFTLASVNVSTTTGDSRSILVISPNQLPQGCVYTFTVRVVGIVASTQLQTMRNSTVTIDLSEQPEDGILNVNPASGVSMETPFTVETLNWKTKTRLMEYKFTLVSAGGAEKTLRPYSVFPKAVVYVPTESGNATQSSIAILRVYVRDEYHRVAVKQVSVKVHAAESTAKLLSSLENVLSLYGDERGTSLDRLGVLVNCGSELIHIRDPIGGGQSAALNSTSLRVALVRQRMMSMLEESSHLWDPVFGDSDVQEQFAQVVHSITQVDTGTMGKLDNTTAILTTTLMSALTFAEKQVTNSSLTQTSLESYLHVSSNVASFMLNSTATEQQVQSTLLRLETVTEHLTDQLYEQQYNEENLKTVRTSMYSLSVVRGYSNYIEGAEFRDAGSEWRYSVQVPRCLMCNSAESYSTTESEGLKMRLNQANVHQQNITSTSQNVTGAVFSLQFMKGDSKFLSEFNSGVRFVIRDAYDTSRLETDETKDGTRPFCAYWDTQSQTWSTRGVQFVDISASQIECITNHTTDFSLLLKYIPAPNLLDINFITGKDSIINLNADNFATSVMMCSLWLVYIVGMIILELWNTVSWGLREWEQNRRLSLFQSSTSTVKVGAMVDGRRKYVEPLWNKFKELHIWLSVILLPSTDSQQYTRSQRLTLLSMLVLGLGLSNALSSGIDDQVQYWITCVVSDLLVAPFIGIGLFLFSKVKPRKRKWLDVERAYTTKRAKSPEFFSPDPSSGDDNKLNGQVVVIFRTTLGHPEQKQMYVKAQSESTTDTPCSSTIETEVSKLQSSHTTNDKTNGDSPKTLLTRIRQEAYRNVNSVNQNKLHFIRQMDSKIDIIVQLMLKAKIRVYGTIIFFMCTLLYFAIIAAGCYVMLYIQWLGIIGILIYTAGGVVSYFAIMSELYIQSKTRAFQKGKLRWHSRFTPVGVLVNVLFIIMLTVLSIAAIVLIMTVENSEDSKFSPGDRLGVSTVVGVFLIGMIGVLLRNIVSAIRSPSTKRRKNGKLPTLLTSHWFPWWFKYPVYVVCWTMMIVASWLLVMYGIKFAREGAEWDFFFALICSNNQNFWLDNPSGIVLSVIVGSILMRLFEAFFFPRDEIIGVNPVGDDLDDLNMEEHVENEIPQRRETTLKKQKQDAKISVSNGPQNKIQPMQEDREV
mmetsp:Transcript_10857/g.40509  ORF Transcript_10857/g.40509 Transcript_10857/m.40509 type:complete len:2267 (-) Transcript_10857:48-6848(-)|eukprot:CAMPEP_0117449584 /NCGR_PEP_ID=MMETSP0759-20121206/8020_1 /TAXON_ID=63605 /ORGANISM="Percolomonas cosmopolitus, Strain WS" /LENGTH=2266 /DNA_ID=CAMNT_0005242063 /DNA_START=118 /DNA_END=6918 /DNA_ORIENTATION=+